MYTDMEQWSENPRRVLVEGLSRRAACREYGLHWHTLTKMLEKASLGTRGLRALERGAIGGYTARAIALLWGRSPWNCSA